MTSIVVLLMFWCARAAAAAAVSFTVGFLDDARSPIVCTADGSDCVTEFTFRGTTRFYIDVPPTYGVGVDLSPVKSGVCKPFNDLYVTKAPLLFANNSLAAFKAALASVGRGKDDPNGLIYASTASCGTTNTLRFYFGVHQLDQGWIGNCATGRFRLRLGDSSHVCGYRREDRLCYAGESSCYHAKLNATVRRDFPVGEPVRCCPAKQPGQSDSVMTALSCTCAGLDRAPPAPVPTAAGTCQSGEFCREKCGITNGISAGSLSYGSCCADCSATDVRLSGSALGCSNTCPAFGAGGGSVSTPAPQWIPQGSPPWQPLTTPQPTSTECDDCDCAQRRCEARCTAESTTVLTFNCLRSGPVFSHMCECQPTRTSDAIFHSQPSVMVISWMTLALAVLFRW